MPSYYSPGRAERRLAWDPYARELSEALRDLRDADPGFRGGLISAPALFREAVLRKRVLWAVMWGRD